jgi:hypothetical protein
LQIYRVTLVLANVVIFLEFIERKIKSPLGLRGHLTAMCYEQSAITSYRFVMVACGK